MGVGSGEYSNANSCKGGASGSQSRESSLALTKRDFMFLLLLKDNIGDGSFIFLKECKVCRWCQYFLIILRANGAEGVNLVTNGNLSSCFVVFIVLSSKERSRNLTLLMDWSTNLKE